MKLLRSMVLTKKLLLTVPAGVNLPGTEKVITQIILMCMYADNDPD